MSRVKLESDRVMVLDGDITITLPDDGCLLSPSCFSCPLIGGCQYDEYRENLARRKSKKDIL